MTLRGRMRSIRAVVAVAGMLAWTSGTVRAEPGQRATDPTPDLLSLEDTALSSEELDALRSGLHAKSAAKRTETFEALTKLPLEAIDAIRERARTMLSEPLRAEVVEGTLTQARHASGSRRADDMVDIRSGVRALLSQSATRTVTALAERVALLRALEALGTRDAMSVAVDVLATDETFGTWEGPRFVHRMGARSVAALIVARTHDAPHIRQWARWGMKYLGVESPAVTLGRLRPAPDASPENWNVLADVLRAYGVVKDLDAVAAVVPFVASERSLVRDAARWSVERYGQNAIWQLRHAYHVHTGREPQRAWSWRRTLRELVASIDGTRLQPVERGVQAGLRAYREGNLLEMSRQFDEALSSAPTYEQRALMADGYAAMGESLLEADDLSNARRAFTRALYLTGSQGEGSRVAETTSQAKWRAQLAFIDAELHLVQGVLDVAGYERAVELDPTHERALDALERFTGTSRPGRSAMQRWAAALGGVLLLAILAIVWKQRRVAAAPT